MAYAFNEVPSRRIGSGDRDAMQELREMTDRERGALESAIRDYRRWFLSLGPREASEIWPSLSGSDDLAFSIFTLSVEHSLATIELNSLAVTVADQALMTFETAAGNVAFASAARVSRLPLQSGWALYDAGGASRGIFGLFGRRSPSVVVGCNVAGQCTAVIGE